MRKLSLFIFIGLIFSCSALANPRSRADVFLAQTQVYQVEIEQIQTRLDALTIAIENALPQMLHSPGTKTKELIEEKAGLTGRQTALLFAMRSMSEEPSQTLTIDRKLREILMHEVSNLRRHSDLTTLLNKRGNEFGNKLLAFAALRLVAFVYVLQNISYFFVGSDPAHLINGILFAALADGFGHRASHYAEVSENHFIYKDAFELFWENLADAAEELGFERPVRPITPIQWMLTLCEDHLLPELPTP